MPKRPSSLKRYSAALLFQYRVVADGVVNHRRTCEKRIIHFQATDSRTALRHAKKRGREAEHRWKNKEGSEVFFEFVGVRDLIGCDPACEPDEVWYQIVEMMTPMERRKTLIPSESKLCAIRNHE
jgi:hypothetical protein